MENDIFYYDKFKILKILSELDNIIFVGGTSEYLQGFKSELRDIDICVTNINDLRLIGYIFTINNIYPQFFKGRYFIKLNNVLIDIFLKENLPNFTIVNNFKCEEIESMINLRCNILDNFNEAIELKNKYILNLDRLQKIKATQIR